MKNNIFFESKKRCKFFRKRILDLSQKVSALHIGGSFSCAEIMDLIINILSNKKERNLFILSKGHASILQYVILEYLGIIKKKDVDNYCTKNGFLGVHPDIGNPGINASTGSLGHGLGMLAGMSVAEKNTNNNIYSILSDGELQEGSTWEAIMLIPSLKLNNVIIFIDNNNLQSLEKTSKSHPGLYQIEEKFKSFGWQSFKCNGHNIKKLYQLVKNKKRNKPLAIIAETIKGYPVSFMMHKPIWHYKSPDKNEYKKAITEIDKL
jgi:transketolase